ncbi:MAG: hypothetical protein ACEY29_01930 [Arsenophonus sp.]
MLHKTISTFYNLGFCWSKKRKLANNELKGEFNYCMCHALCITATYRYLHYLIRRQSRYFFNITVSFLKQ